MYSSWDGEIVHIEDYQGDRCPYTSRCGGYFGRNKSGKCKHSYESCEAHNRIKQEDIDRLAAANP